jgi:hypothetical protein
MTAPAIASRVIPVQPAAVYGGVPPLTVSFCAEAPADEKLSVDNDSDKTLVAVTWIAIWLVMLGFDESETMSSHPPAPAGAIVIVDPLTAAFATPEQPVTL